MKKTKDTRTRQKIIMDNIIDFMEEKKIDKESICNKLHISPSTFSKWKNQINNISIDYLDEITKILNVNFNDLFYSSSEKERILLLSNSERYIPINAQKVIDSTKSIAFENKHYKMLITILIISIFLFAITFFMADLHFVFFLLPFFSFFIVIIVKNKVQYVDKYIVNYLDDVFYKIENPKNQFYVKSLILKIITIIVIVVDLFVIIKDINNNFFAIYFLLLLMNCIRTLYSVCIKTKEMKKEIYGHEDEIYYSSLNDVLYSISLISCFLILTIKLKYMSIISLLTLILDLISKVLNYILVSKKFSEYELYISDEKGEIKKMYNNKFPN